MQISHKSSHNSDTLGKVLHFAEIWELRADMGLHVSHIVHKYVAHIRAYPLPQMSFFWLLILLKGMVFKRLQPRFTHGQSVFVAIFWISYPIVPKRCVGNSDQPSLTPNISGHSETWERSVQNMGTPLLYAGWPLLTIFWLVNYKVENYQPLLVQCRQWEHHAIC